MIPVREVPSSGGRATFAIFGRQFEWHFCVLESWLRGLDLTEI
jgi:hypothetical protein